MAANSNPLPAAVARNSSSSAGGGGSTSSGDSAGNDYYAYDYGAMIYNAAKVASVF